MSCEDEVQKAVTRAKDYRGGEGGRRWMGLRGGIQWKMSKSVI